MRRLLIITLLFAFMGGCSMFKQTSVNEQRHTERTKQKDITTDVLEDIKITIPPALFSEVFGVEYDQQNEAHVDNKKQGSTAVKDRSNDLNKPVVIEVHRKIDKQDNTTVTTQTNSQKEVKTKSKTETDGLFSFGFGFMIAIAVVVGGGIYIAFKFYF